MRISVARVALVAVGICGCSVKGGCSHNSRHAKPPLKPEKMALVPAGWYIGGNTGPRNVLLANPPQRFWVSAFKIDVYEVVWARYAACADAGACRPYSAVDTVWPDPNERSRYRSRIYPALVRWKDASDYCHWRGKRLPTEAEWEKAARGTDRRIYPWGNEPPTAQLARFVYDLSTRRPILGGTESVMPGPVGTHPRGASPYGVQDMAGNAPEWVSDWYRGLRYRTHLWHYTMIDPPGPPPAKAKDDRFHVTKSLEDHLNIAARGQGLPTQHTNMQGSNLTASVVAGFRCARSVPGPPPPRDAGAADVRAQRPASAPSKRKGSRSPNRHTESNARAAARKQK